MNRTESHKQLQEIFIKIRDYKEGFITNFFIGEERCNLLISKNRLFSLDYDKCSFVLFKDDGFYHLYFLSVSKELLGIALEELIKKYSDVIFVTDIIGSDAVITEFSKLFELYGFKKYSKLFRMSRLTVDESDGLLDSRIEYANSDQVNQIKNTLDLHFDKYCEQIPLLEEINQWIIDKRIIYMLEKDRIIGLIIFEINGMTSHLRYWFVDPDYRNKKIGSALLRRFFYECRNTKRELFWVMTNNENAIARYEHYGFKTEQMFDQILIRK